MMKRHLGPILLILAICLIFFSIFKKHENPTISAIRADLEVIKSTLPYRTFFSSLEKVKMSRLDSKIPDIAEISQALEQSLPIAGKGYLLEIDIFIVTKSEVIDEKEASDSLNITFSFIDLKSGNKIHELVRTYKKK